MKYRKIVCLVSNDINQDRRMQRICTSLYHLGFDVSLVGRQKKQSLQLGFFPFSAYRLNCIFQRGIFFYIELLFRQYWYITRTKPSIIYSVDADTLLAGFLYKLKSKAFWIFDAHEFFEESYEIQSRPLIQKVWEKILFVCIHKVDLCMTVGQELSMILENKYGKKFHVVRNCPPYRKAEPFQEYESKILIYQGMLNRGRGLIEVILALHHLEGYHLELAGNGDLEKELKKLVKEENLESRVIFHGFLEGASLDAFTQRPVIGLNLLDIQSKSYKYSLANKAFDYMMAGVPSLQMDFPEYKKLNDRFNIFILIPDLNPKNIAKAILSIKNYQELNIHNLEAAKEFNWEKEAIVLRKIFKDLGDLNDNVSI